MGAAALPRTDWLEPNESLCEQELDLDQLGFGSACLC